MGAREVWCDTTAALATVIGYEIRKALATASLRSINNSAVLAGRRGD